MANSPQRLQNLYVARPTAQERPCFVCNKFTSVVLTSADNSNADWFYVCRAHLGDFNFCSKLGGNNKPVKSPTEVKKETLANRPPESDSVTELVSSIGSAWKSWRGSNKKTEEEDDKEKKKDDKEKEEEAKSKKEEAPSSPSPPSTPSSPQQPIRFIIQRDYFYLRQREFTKKAQKKEATEKLKTLQFPEVPKNMPTLK